MLAIPQHPTSQTTVRWDRSYQSQWLIPRHHYITIIITSHMCASVAAHSPSHAHPSLPGPRTWRSASAQASSEPASTERYRSLASSVAGGTPCRCTAGSTPCPRAGGGTPCPCAAGGTPPSRDARGEGPSGPAWPEGSVVEADADAGRESSRRLAAAGWASGAEGVGGAEPWADPVSSSAGGGGGKGAGAGGAGGEGGGGGRVAEGPDEWMARPGDPGGRAGGEACEGEACPGEAGAGEAGEGEAAPLGRLDAGRTPPSWPCSSRQTANT